MRAYAISTYSTGNFQRYIAKMILVHPVGELVEPPSHPSWFKKLHAPNFR